VSFYGTDPGSGCYAIDKSFTNFSVLDSSNIGTAQSGSTDDFTGSGPPVSSVATPWLVYGTFTPASAADWRATGTGTGGQVAGTINYLADSQQHYINPVPGYPGPPGAVLQIYSASLGMVGTTGGAGDSVSLTETFCFGAAACTLSDAATLTVTMAGGNPSALTYACNVGATFQGNCENYSTVMFSSAISVATLNVTDAYKLSVSGTDTDTLNSFVNDFGEEDAPEPSSFVLLGTALAGAAFSRLRPGKAKGSYAPALRCVAGFPGSLAIFTGRMRKESRRGN
jgi:PEP-CTERM motif-containing protein